MWVLESLVDAGRVATARSQQWSAGRGQRDLFYPDISVYRQDNIYFGPHFGIVKIVIGVGKCWLYADPLVSGLAFNSRVAVVSVARGQCGLCSFLSLVNALQWK